MKLKCPKLPKGVSRAELKRGIKVEYEHTDDPKVAECIARAHLAECRSYYRRLAKLEKACEVAEK